MRVAKRLVLLALGCAAVAALAEPAGLARDIAAIDAQAPGQLGVYVKDLASGEVVKHQADRYWYLSSTVKVPLAVAVLQAVERGDLSLDKRLVLRRSDFVDGAGDLLWQQPGGRYSLAQLVEKSIENSDSTATDMLMRELGVDAFNEQIRRKMVPDGFRPFTTIIQVRYDAYGELHSRAAELSNMDYVEIRSAGDYDSRVRAFRRKLGLSAADLQVPTLETAFGRYYQRDLNSGTLVAFGTLLERLVRGELLSSNHTGRLLNHMAKITTGDTRLQAGLPNDVAFSQKTGTQIERACNVGALYPHSPKETVIVAACAEDYGKIEIAEKQLQEVAEALRRHLLK